MELFYPVKNPINQSNLFGANPAEYAPLGQKGHPGVDFEAPLYTPIYAPVSGAAFYVHDDDNGDGLWIRVPDNVSVSYTVILWHMPPATDTVHWIIPTGQGVVTNVKAGQLIGYTGNSGYPLESTGPHLHLGVIPCASDGGALDPNNGFDGCVDPMPFFNGKYAIDINATPTEAAAASAIDAANDIVQETAVSTTLTPIQKANILARVETFLEELKQLLL